MNCKLFLVSLSTSDWLTIISTGITCVGLTVTVFTLNGVRRVNATLLRYQRLPELLKSLKKKMTSLNTASLSESGGYSANTLSLLAQIRADLKSASSKLKASEITETMKAALSLEQQKKDTSNLTLQDLYGKLGGVTSTIENHVKDAKWEHKR